MKRILIGGLCAFLSHDVLAMDEFVDEGWKTVGPRRGTGSKQQAENAAQELLDRRQSHKTKHSKTAPATAARPSPLSGVIPPDPIKTLIESLKTPAYDTPVRSETGALAQALRQIPQDHWEQACQFLRGLGECTQHAYSLTAQALSQLPPQVWPDLNRRYESLGGRKIDPWHVEVALKIIALFPDPKAWIDFMVHVRRFLEQRDYAFARECTLEFVTALGKVDAKERAAFIQHLLTLTNPTEKKGFGAHLMAKILVPLSPERRATVVVRTQSLMTPDLEDHQRSRLLETAHRFETQADWDAFLRALKHLPPALKGDDWVSTLTLLSSTVEPGEVETVTRQLRPLLDRTRGHNLSGDFFNHYRDLSVEQRAAALARVLDIMPEGVSAHYQNSFLNIARSIPAHQWETYRHRAHALLPKTLGPGFYLVGPNYFLEQARSLDKPDIFFETLGIMAGDDGDLDHRKIFLEELLRQWNTIADPDLFKESLKSAMVLIHHRDREGFLNAQVFDTHMALFKKTVQSYNHKTDWKIFTDQFETLRSLSTTQLQEAIQEALATKSRL